MSLDRATIEKLVELNTSLVNLTNQVQGMDAKLDELRTEHAQKTSNEITTLNTKVDRLEKIIYFVGSLAGIEGVALLVQALSDK